MKPLLLLICLAALMVACADQSTKTQEFIHTPSGMSYKIIHNGYGDKPVLGETLKLQVKQLYRDSILSDTRDSLPFYQPFDTARMSKDAYEVFKQVSKADSIVFWVPTDSAFNNKPMPPFAKKGERLYTTVYVQEILGPKFDVQSDYKREMLLARSRDSIRYFKEHPEAPRPPQPPINQLESRDQP